MIRLRSLRLRWESINLFKRCVRQRCAVRRLSCALEHSQEIVRLGVCLLGRRRECCRLWCLANTQQSLQVFRFGVDRYRNVSSLLLFIITLIIRSQLHRLCSPALIQLPLLSNPFLQVPKERRNHVELVGAHSVVLLATFMLLEARQVFDRVPLNRTNFLSCLWLEMGTLGHTAEHE